MSKHTLEIPPADPNDTAGAPYAETLTVDEGGIDLKVDGETIISASFEGIDPFQLAYEVLPETFTFDSQIGTFAEWEESLNTLAAEVDAVGDEEVEWMARLALTVLARRNGYEK